MTRAVINIDCHLVVNLRNELIRANQTVCVLAGAVSATIYFATTHSLTPISRASITWCVLQNHQCKDKCQEYIITLSYRIHLVNVCDHTNTKLLVRADLTLPQPKPPYVSIKQHMCVPITRGYLHKGKGSLFNLEEGSTTSTSSPLITTTLTSIVGYVM